MNTKDINCKMQSSETIMVVLTCLRRLDQVLCLKVVMKIDCPMF